MTSSLLGNALVVVVVMLRSFYFQFISPYCFHNTVSVILNKKKERKEMKCVHPVPTETWQLPKTSQHPKAYRNL